MVLRLSGSINLPEVRLGRNNGLRNELIYALLQSGNVIAASLQYAIDLRQTSLVAAAGAPLVLILSKFIRELVDGVVGQMHEVILKVLTVRHFIRHSGKTSKALFVDVYAQRVNTIQQNVYAEIEFEAIN